STKTKLNLNLLHVEVDSVSRKGNPDYFNIKRSLRPPQASQANGSIIHQNECVNYLNKLANKPIEKVICLFAC
ncbi:MAG: hypothetical protein ACYTX0_60490, partial [Nostoc sp.]